MRSPDTVLEMTLEFDIETVHQAAPITHTSAHERTHTRSAWWDMIWSKSLGNNDDRIVLIHTEQRKTK